MKNFKDYEDLIRNKVKEFDDKDSNWEWSVMTLSKYRVLIHWSYLDYVDGKRSNCFVLRFDGSYGEEGESLVVARTPQDCMISAYEVNEIPNKFQLSLDSAIKRAIENIANYAHSRY